ncbi:MAG: hypothetical protein JRJ47_10315 [Deltaproteobacteria bacterium]|nr:hypothetical protein [Deltaproteobacteria bacterium]
MKNRSRKVVPRAANIPTKVRSREEDSGKGAFWKGFVLSAILALVILWLLPVRYEVNDELGIIMTLSGRHGVRPDPHSPFVISHALHYVLCFLYTYWPSIPWLGMLMYFAVYLGCSLILSLFFRSKEGGKYTLLAVPPFVLYLGYCFSVISVTSASLLLEFAIFLYLMEWTIKERCPVKSARFYALFLSFCFLLSYSLRWSMVLKALCFGIPVLFFAKREQFKRALPFVAALAVFIAGDRALLHYTSTDEHKAFADYTKVRSVFSDTVKGFYNGDITLGALDKVGWTLDDYAFFRFWILYDSELFNLDTVKAFTKANDPQKDESVFGLIPKRIMKSYDKSRHYTIVLAFSILSFFLYRFHDLLGLSRNDRLRIVCSLGFIIGSVIFFMYYRFPGRLFIPLYTYSVGASFLVFQVGNKSFQGSSRVTTSRRIAVVSGMLLVVLSLGQVYAQGKVLVADLATRERVKDYIHRCMGVMKNRTICGDPLLVLMDPSTGLRSEAVHPLKELSDFPEVRIFPSGSKINSPAYFDALRQLGLEDGGEFLKWLINNEEALLVLNTNSNERTELAKHLWESYYFKRIAPGQGVRIVPVHDFRGRGGGGLIFYSVMGLR